MTALRLEDWTHFEYTALKVRAPGVVTDFRSFASAAIASVFSIVLTFAASTCLSAKAAPLDIEQELQIS
jgi:hypothetical protein